MWLDLALFFPWNWALKNTIFSEVTTKCEVQSCWGTTLAGQCVELTQTVSNIQMARTGCFSLRKSHPHQTQTARCGSTSTHHKYICCIAGALASNFIAVYWADYIHGRMPRLESCGGFQNFLYFAHKQISKPRAQLDLKFNQQPCLHKLPLDSWYECSGIMQTSSVEYNQHQHVLWIVLWQARSDKISAPVIQQSKRNWDGKVYAQSKPNWLWSCIQSPPH